ncbi:MAG TPA: hypothetical protein GXX18_00865 [Bacillales bacterium]|nr:hypothetical protein [Bacillales bacterium]
MEGILNQILQELKDVKQEVSEVKQGQGRLEANQDRFELNQERLESKVDSLISEMCSNFKYTNDRLDEHRKVFKVVASEITGVKIDIDYLNFTFQSRHNSRHTNIINIRCITSQ